jgi:hypothetical protein
MADELPPGEPARRSERDGLHADLHAEGLALEIELVEAGYRDGDAI